MTPWSWGGQELCDKSTKVQVIKRVTMAGGVVKNCPKQRDIIYGRPLIKQTGYFEIINFNSLFRNCCIANCYILDCYHFCYSHSVEKRKKVYSLNLLDSCSHIQFPMSCCKKAEAQGFNLIPPFSLRRLWTYSKILIRDKGELLQ